MTDPVSGAPDTSGVPGTLPRGDALLAVRGLRKRFPLPQGLGQVLRKVPRPGIVALDGIDLDVPVHTTVAVVGESGSGKSTLARVVLRLIEPDAGSVLFDGTDVVGADAGAMRTLRKRMQIVFQDPYSSLNPRMTVGAILSEVLSFHGVGGGGDERRQRIADLLTDVGLSPNHASRFPHEFSGGQRQRIGIARALALKPDLVILDEPVSALDVSVQAQILNLLEDVGAEHGLTYLFIAHDLSVVHHISDRVAVMYLGRIVEQAPTNELFANPHHPYTRALLAAIPRPDPTTRPERPSVSGEIGSVAASEEGCPFRSRCPMAMARCAETPPWVTVAPDHQSRCWLDAATDLQSRCA